MPLYEDCFTEAARIVMQKLCQATGLEVGSGAFQYFLPDKTNVFSLSITGGDGSGLAGCAVTSLKMNATIEGRFTTVEQAQQFALKVLSIVPLSNSGVVKIFHCIGQPVIVSQVETLANASKAAILYRVTLPCEVVFTVATG